MQAAHISHYAGWWFRHRCTSFWGLLRGQAPGFSVAVSQMDGCPAPSCVEHVAQDQGSGAARPEVECLHRVARLPLPGSGGAVSDPAYRRAFQRLNLLRRLGLSRPEPADGYPGEVSIMIK